MKWEDVLRRYVAKDMDKSWMEVAQDKDRWNVMANGSSHWFSAGRGVEEAMDNVCVDV